MNTPYGLEIVENCTNCKLKRDDCFCNLSPAVLKLFSAISHQTTFPPGATLFVEGQTSRGVFLLCSGEVKLSTSSRDGKVLILKMAGPGEMLGLSAVISGIEYELTAETAVPCQVNFIAREPLLELMARYGEAGLRSGQALSREFQSAYRDIHDLILARSSAGKLAKLLLSWTPPSTSNTKEIRVSSGQTHEEMAQMIGASRETDAGNSQSYGAGSAGFLTYRLGSSGNPASAGFLPQGSGERSSPEGDRSFLSVVLDGFFYGDVAAERVQIKRGGSGMK